MGCVDCDECQVCIECDDYYHLLTESDVVTIAEHRGDALGTDHVTSAVTDHAGTLAGSAEVGSTLAGSTEVPRFDMKPGMCHPCPKNCANCTSGKCVQCGPKAYFTDVGECVKDCGEGWFGGHDERSGNAVCMKCHEACTQCYGADISECTGCAEGYVKADGEDGCIPDSGGWIQIHTPHDTTFYSLKDVPQQQLVHDTDIVYRTLRFLGHQNAHIGLFCGERPQRMEDDYTKMYFYEVILGGWGNAASAIRRRPCTEFKDIEEHNIITKENAGEGETCLDNDYCISTEKGWGADYNCENSEEYCESYADDMNECCPRTCKQC